ncbi:hypothetical protein L839_0323 [Mycobacterium avium MAV_120809_2495]|nr:hypothetical protein L839_0323 [Mycobacterium avium MAV_120809_2495]
MAACWISGLSCDKAGRPGNCGAALGGGAGWGAAAGSAAAPGHSPSAATDAVTTAAKPLDRIQVVATVSSGSE